MDLQENHNIDLGENSICNQTDEMYQADNDNVEDIDLQIPQPSKGNLRGGKKGEDSDEEIETGNNRGGRMFLSNFPRDSHDQVILRETPMVEVYDPLDLEYH